VIIAQGRYRLGLSSRDGFDKAPCRQNTVSFRHGAFQRASTAVQGASTLHIARSSLKGACHDRLVRRRNGLTIQAAPKGSARGADAVSAHIAASQETIEQSRVVIVQIDEQINRMERELG
jgi:hypothetical protein